MRYTSAQLRKHYSIRGYDSIVLLRVRLMITTSVFRKHTVTAKLCKLKTSNFHAFHVSSYLIASI